MWMQELTVQLFKWLKETDPVTVFVFTILVFALFRDRIKSFFKKGKNKNIHENCSNYGDLKNRLSEIMRLYAKEANIFYQQILYKEMLEVERTLYQVENTFVDRFTGFLKREKGFKNPINSKEYKEYILLTNKILAFTKEMLRFSMKQNGFQNMSDKEFDSWVEKRVKELIGRVSTKINDVFSQGDFDNLDREELREFHNYLIPSAQNEFEDMYRRAREVQKTMMSEIYKIDEQIDSLFPGLDTTGHEVNKSEKNKAS